MVLTFTSGTSIRKSFVLPTQCIYVFCVDLRTNSDYFPTHCNRDQFLAVHSMKVLGTVEIQLRPFLTSAPDGDEESISGAGRFTPAKECGYPLNRRLSGPRVCLEVMQPTKDTLHWLQVKADSSDPQTLPHRQSYLGFKNLVPVLFD